MLVQLEQGWYEVSGIKEPRTRKRPESFNMGPDPRKSAPKKKRNSAKKIAKQATVKV